MSLQIAGGLAEDGIIIGNTYDKYRSKNPIVRWMMNGFDASLSELVGKVSPTSIHDIGCGEGYWTMRWHEQGIRVKGSDFSRQVIDISRKNAKAQGIHTDLFQVSGIYDVNRTDDTAELVVCCEVLEHLESPEAGLKALRSIVGKWLIVSVPREPIWCLLNLARGKYVRDLGNTPGHIQHWSRSSFIRTVSQYFEVVEVRSPMPWTMLLCKLKDK